MDCLFQKVASEKFTWSLKAYCDQSIEFSLTRQQNGSWKAYSDEIEAALSLWLYSVSEQEEDEYQKASRTSHPEDAWLRSGGSPAKRSLRLLGSYTKGLHRDLSWWMHSEATRIMNVEECDDGTLEVEDRRIVGCGSGSGGASQKPVRLARYKTGELAKFSFDLADNHDSEGGARHSLLGTESYDSLKLLYAQDMFSAFMWAAAKTLEDSVEGGADMRLDNTGNDNNWQSFRLQNAQLSEMAQDIQTTGLGSLDQIYLSIIPPLSVQHKLPQVDVIVELARKYAQRHEQLQHWKQAGDAYLWLFRVGKTFQKQSSIANKATAVLVEYLRVVVLAIKSKEAQVYEERDIYDLRKLKLSMERELETADRGTLSSLMRLYEEQGRRWTLNPVQEVGLAGILDTSYPETFNLTELHLLARSEDRIWEFQALRDWEGVSGKDIHDWTPLHYAAAKGIAGAAKILLEHGADVNARDLLKWTPLHHACKRGETSMVHNLLQEGAELDVRGRDGVAPLHCAALNSHTEVDHYGRTPLHLAAANGHEKMVKLLAEELNANVEAKDDGGQMPLHLAAAGGHEEVVRLLAIQLEADKDAKDRYGQTPLHFAASSYSSDRSRHKAIISLLIKAGAEKEARDKNGRTPLQLAKARGHANVIRLLVEEGADKEAEDRND